MPSGAQLTALELFFDLVFVLAITQCTALMARKLIAVAMIVYETARCAEGRNQI